MLTKQRILSYAPWHLLLPVSMYTESNASTDS